ncbi:glycosyl transferase [Komagataeibacter diospyri]|uniref:Glycosyl transferase n=2 Tax=Komagataeibacter diospyri TaxID=1932662 RepID=A0A4P5NV72_9PROT|nr:glycosyl transferase [Komagataeibacter diospyri]
MNLKAKDDTSELSVKKVREFPFFPINFALAQKIKPLYMNSPFPDFEEDGSILIECGETVTFDGFLTALYEREINQIIPDAKLYLELSVIGNCRVGLYHRAQDGEVTEFVKRKYVAEEGEQGVRKIRIDFDITGSEATIGRWYFVIEALTSDLMVKGACWGMYDAMVRDVRPCFVICTFKREKQLGANVDRLVSALTEHSPNFGIMVVDNACTIRRAEHWPANVRLIPQRNVGGAGGFGRGMFEALQDGSYTHVIMLDDDADVEPTAITRLTNLFSVASDPYLFLGGAQLDVYNPVMLADGGAHWIPDRFERPFGRLPPANLGKIETKDGLMRNHQLNFNGWWLFGGSVEGFKKFGMPLPCFVHLDDVEYGIRISLGGGHILSVPGIGVWHEPYYAKPEGWFAYYNIRNELIRLSCHTEALYARLLQDNFETYHDDVQKRIEALMRRVARLLIRRFYNFINIYHYGSAMLLVLAIEDFLKGPNILAKTDAADLHASIMQVYKRFNTNYQFSSDLPIGAIPTPPGTSGKFIVPWIQKTSSKRNLLAQTYNLYQKISHNGNVSPLRFKNSPLGILSTRRRQITVFKSRNDINWRDIRAGRDWAYYDPQKIGYHIFAYNPDLYHEAHERLQAVLKDFKKHVGQIQGEWAGAYERLISEPFWADLVRTFEVKE